MKSSILKTTMLGGFIFANCCIYAAENIYFNESKSTTEPTRYLNQSNNWYIDEERTQQFTGTLGNNYNGIFNVENGACATVRGTDTLTLNSLTYNIASSSSSNNYLVSFANGGIINLAEDFNLNVVMNPYAAGEIAQTIRMYGSNQFNIGGDFNIDYNRNKSGGYIGINIMNDPSVSYVSSFTVKGNLNTISRQQDARIRLNTDVNTFTVEGVANIADLVWTIGNASSSNGTISVGGMNTIGGPTSIMRLNNMKAPTTLTLTNASKQEAVTTLGYVDQPTALDITMRATDAKNGYQIIRYRKGVLDATDANLGYVIVDTGRLDIGMYEGMKGSHLSMSGRDAIFSATSSDSGNAGTVTFGSGEWYAGKIVIDIEGEVAYDKIAFEGKFNKTGNINDMALEFVFDGYSMKEFINAKGGEFTLSDVITYETGSTMKGTVFEGNTNGFEWEAVFGDTALSVTFTVPEPAEISALLGALVLAIAIIRRRK